MTRLCIAGGPRTGKSTLASSHAAMHGGWLWRTDDLIGAYDWSEASAEVARWMDKPGPWCIEGVAVGRALRKWLDAHPGGTPCDRVLWCGRPHVTLTLRQAGMAKGCETVWREVAPRLALRGVEIVGWTGGSDAQAR